MIEEAIITRLRADADVVALVGQKSYIIEAPESVNPPYAVLSNISAYRQMAHDGPLGVTDALLQISCIGNSAANAKRIAKAVIAALHGFRGSVGSDSIFYAEIENENDLPPSPDFGYQVAVDLRILFEE